MPTTLKLYRTYSFRTKDPVIDEIRTVFDDVGARYRDIEETCDVSNTTLRGWFYGKTRRPQFATIRATARALGFDYTLQPSDKYEFKPYQPGTVKQERKKLSRQATSTIRRASRRPQANGNGKHK